MTDGLQTQESNYLQEPDQVAGERMWLPKEETWGWRASARPRTTSTRSRQPWLSLRLGKSQWWRPLHRSPRFHLERGWETRTNGPTRPPTKSRPSIHHSSALTSGASRPTALPTTPSPLRMWSKGPSLHPHHQSVHVVHKRNVIHLAKTNDCFSQGM